ncbi:MAG: putative DNA binding domain-containing protein [Eubacterium sp.]|nr:putative DNA binding domain-containing protein [Eubacterium sp.]
MIKSVINPMLTLEYMTTKKENKFFDRKSVKVKPSDIAPWIPAFANAEGGTLIIGISDKTMKVEGINSCDDEKLNLFLNLVKDYCRPMPAYKEEFLDVINYKGEKDRILLLHIFPSVDRVIYMTNDTVWLRIGDKTRELRGEDIKLLEYEKGSRHYEDEINEDAEIDDLDKELIEEYKSRIGAVGVDTAQILRGRGLMKRKNGKDYLTNAAILLFAENVAQFYPNCRVRFLRYMGTEEKVGTEMNVVKDKSFEEPILKLIGKAKEFIKDQLREFNALDPNTGRFSVIPEYPEFAWLEGIVNAVAHREYGMEGKYIKVAMFDDRLEIDSPGKLPNIVTVDNIRTTSFSRNPRIARVMTDFEHVRELNEGVKRIYSDMAEFFLDAPIYTEPGKQGVKLILKNNIMMRSTRQKESARDEIGEEIWNQLDSDEQKMLIFISTRKEVKAEELANLIQKTKRTVNNKINKLIELDVIKLNGNKYDNTHTYSLR